MIDGRRYLDAPGEGEFTQEEDRMQIAQVLGSLLDAIFLHFCYNKTQ